VGPVRERLLGTAVPASLIVALAWSRGGYDPRTWGAVLLLEAIALASIAILATTVVRGRRAFLVVAALLGLAAWQLVSRAWAVDPDQTVLEAERTLLYAVAVATALLVVDRRRAQDVVVGVLLGAGAVTAGGLARHVLGSPGERFESPIGYANAAGILAAVTLLLGLGIQSDHASWRRALGAGLAPPAAVALYLSLSRGALLAALLGLCVLVAAQRPPSRLRGAVIAAVPAGVAAVLAIAAGGLDDRGATIRDVAVLLGVAGLGLVGAVVCARRSRVTVRTVPSRLAAGLTSAAAVVVLVGVVLAGAYEVGRSRSAPAAQQGAPSRLLSSTSDRGEYWKVAARSVRDDPLGGVGAGGFERTWLRERPALIYVRDAHNLYLETLAELGPLGLALLATAVLLPLVGVRRAAAEPTGAAALAAYVALLAHAVLDWDWELPAVMLCTLFLGVALLRLAGREHPVPLGTRTTAVLLATAAAVGALALVVHVGNGATAEAQEALERGDADAARRNAERARRFAPWAASPWRLLGEAELAEGSLGPARRHLLRAVREDPYSWDAWRDLALVTRSREREAALRRAQLLDPLAPT
jgi:O-antigen ligase